MKTTLLLSSVQSAAILTTARKLILPNAYGSGSGVYKCLASRIVRQAQSMVRLFFLFYFIFFIKEQTCERRCNHRRGRKNLECLDCLLFLVLVHPRFSFNSGPRHAMQKSTFTFPACKMTGYPTPLVTWRKFFAKLPQGRVRYNNRTRQNFTSSQRLIIRAKFVFVLGQCNK